MLEIGSLSRRNGWENFDHSCTDLTESWAEKRQEKASKVDLPGYFYRCSCDSDCIEHDQVA